MSGPAEIVDYEPALRDGVVALQRHLWSADPARASAYFAWKHEENPYVPAPLASIALAGGEVVGMRALMGTRWEVDGAAEPVTLLYADDFAIAPDHRSSGLAARIMEETNARAARVGAPFLVNLSASEITALQSYATGWRRVVAMQPVVVGVPGTRPGRRLSPVARRTGTRSPFHRLDAHAARRTPVVVEREPRPEAMAALLARVPSRGGIRHLRDAAFLAWRYRNPLHDYRFLTVGGAELEGLLVLQHALEGPKAGRVRIVDWEAVDEQTLDRLLAAAAELGRFDELYAWRNALPDGAAAILDRHGLSPADPPLTARGYPALLLRAVDREAEPETWSLGGRRLLDPGAWDLRLVVSMYG